MNHIDKRLMRSHPPVSSAPSLEAGIKITQGRDTATKRSRRRCCVGASNSAIAADTMKPLGCGTPDQTWKLFMPGMVTSASQCDEARETSSEKFDTDRRRDDQLRVRQMPVSGIHDFIQCDVHSPGASTERSDHDHAVDELLRCREPKTSGSDLRDQVLHPV